MVNNTSSNAKKIAGMNIWRSAPFAAAVTKTKIRTLEAWLKRDGALTSKVAGSYLP